MTKSFDDFNKLNRVCVELTITSNRLRNECLLLQKDLSEYVEASNQYVNTM